MATAPQGQKGATGRAGNSNTHLSWVGSGITHDTTGQVLRKSGGSNSWANGYAYTNYVLTSGCSVSFRSGCFKFIVYGWFKYNNFKKYNNCKIREY